VSNADHERQNVFEEHAIHVGTGFRAQERPHVVEALATLGAHLRRSNPDAVGVEVSVQDRGGKEQRITLRTTLPGYPRLVAVAADRDVTQALSHAKRELITQIDHHKSAREPMNSRQLRSETIRHPASGTSIISADHRRG
jgi:ribosome-associated translation inhibitor RaiA